MTIETYVRSPWFKGMLTGLCGALVLLIVFQAGIAIGYRKAMFAGHIADRYYRAFEPREGRGFGGGIDGIAAHGVAGEVISISLPTFVVEEPDKMERIVRIGEETEIRRFRSAASTTDLVAGEFVVVIGEPNDDAEVAAKLIRLMPPPRP